MQSKNLRRRMLCVEFWIVLLCALFPHALVAGEPYFITIQKLELKKDSGEWLSILEPDRKVDLMNTEATVSFFNNGRVPPERFKNFRVTFDDHGKITEMTRNKDLDAPFPVKKGSFVSVSFELELDSKKIKETRMRVDDQEFIESGDNIEMIRRERS